MVRRRSDVSEPRAEARDGAFDLSCGAVEGSTRIAAPDRCGEAHACDASEIGRQTQLQILLLDQQGPLSTEESHAQSGFEDHVVPGHGNALPAVLEHVVGGQQQHHHVYGPTHLDQTGPRALTRFDDAFVPERG